MPCLVINNSFNTSTHGLSDMITRCIKFIKRKKSLLIAATAALRPVLIKYTAKILGHYHHKNVSTTGLVSKRERPGITNANATSWRQRASAPHRAIGLAPDEATPRACLHRYRPETVEKLTNMLHHADIAFLRSTWARTRHPRPCYHVHTTRTMVWSTAL